MGPEMKRQFIEFLGHPLFYGGAILLVAIIIQWTVRRTIRKLADDQFLTAHTAHRLRAMSRFALSLLALLVTLRATGAMGEVWAIVSATVAALAVGFVATWSLLSNITSALVLLGFRPFRIGDEIEVIEADKILASGTVLDLNLFYTTLGSEGAATRIPNNLLLQRVVRVMRSGVAPDPSQDGLAPFYSSTSNPRPEPPKK
jgi:small-conductance mechanosensitive channel